MCGPDIEKELFKPGALFHCSGGHSGWIVNLIEKYFSDFPGSIDLTACEKLIKHPQTLILLEYDCAVMPTFSGYARTLRCSKFHDYEDELYIVNPTTYNIISPDASIRFMSYEDDCTPAIQK